MLPAACVQERRTKLGPAVADLVAMPGGGDQTRVAERQQMARDACRAELSGRGERGRRQGLVQGGQDNRACAAEQPAQRAGRRRWGHRASG